MSQSFYINFNSLIASKLEILPGDQLSRFFNSKMANQQIIVVTTDYLKINNLRDVQKTLIIKYIFYIF